MNWQPIVDIDNNDILQSSTCKFWPKLLYFWSFKVPYNSCSAPSMTSVGLWPTTWEPAVFTCACGAVHRDLMKWHCEIGAVTGHCCSGHCFPVGCWWFLCVRGNRTMTEASQTESQLCALDWQMLIPIGHSTEDWCSYMGGPTKNKQTPKPMSK